MTFRLNNHYSREVIHRMLGGSMQAYLPNKKGVVLCACLSLDLNPKAPEVILTGIGPQIERSAHILSRQEKPIPVFIKRGVNCWEFVGDYKFERWSDDPGEIEAHAKLANRTDITRVIHMSAVVKEGLT